MDTGIPTVVPVRRKGRPASFWIAIFLFLLLLGSLLTNLALAVAASAGGREEAFQETHLLGSKTAEDKVLMISLSGTIMPQEAEGPFSRRDMVASILSQLQQARKDKHVKAVLLEVNSPGGGITASDILYHHLALFKKEAGVPLVALCMDLTASGGYYAASAADFIMAHETSMVGSIGVIAHFPNFTGLMQKIGVTVYTIKSIRANGTESVKDIGSPYRPMKPQEREIIQRMITNMWNRFVDVVASGRQGKLTRPQIADLADGRIWTGKEALDLHLIDGLGYEEDAWKKAADLGKAPQAKLVAYRRPSGVLHDLLGSSQSHVTLDEMLRQYSTDLGESASPRFMYLWTGYL